MLPKSWREASSRSVRAAVAKLTALWRRQEDESALWRTLYDTLPMAVWILDAEQRYIVGNAELCRWLNLPLTRIIGRSVREVLAETGHLAPVAIEAVLAGNEAALKNGHSTLGVEELELSGGSRILIEFRGVPITLRDGRQGVLGVGRDITEARQEEARSRQRDRALEELARLLPGSLFQLETAADRPAATTYLSPQAGAIFGVPVVELTTNVHRISELVHPEDLPGVAAAMTYQQSGVVRIEYRITRPDTGELRWIESTASPQPLDSGRVLWHGYLADITLRKQREEQLRLSSDVFRCAQEGIVITDEQRCILQVNSVFETLSGFTSDELLGRDILQLSLADDLDPAAVMTHLLAGHTWRSELAMRAKNGRSVDLQVTVSGVRNELDRITRLVLLLTDITDLKAHQQRLERMAHYDPLTGLANRSLFADRLQQAMAATQRNGQLLAVCYLDLDGFKPINDRHGHPAGDELLVQVAKRLQLELRQADTVARIGGDEFALLLTELDDTHGAELAIDRLLQALKAPFSLNHGYLVSISASIGVTLVPHDHADAENLLRHADQAMYLAKQGGRNRYHLFDPVLDRQTQALQQLRVRLEDALQHGELELYYQPKVDLATGTVVGAEALLRWNDPARGLVPPGEFLPALDGGPLTLPLGEWVIHSALRQIAAWNAVGLQIPVSVNISANHLQNARFADRLQALLAEVPAAAPSLLELEVLESAALQDIDAVCRLMHEVRALGVSFALDDFGTGYSSLAYLQRLPIQTLKIDQSFVRAMLDETASLVIVEGIMGLARPFGLQVIAEGVETEAQGLQLLQAGCGLAQGYSIARPMPAAAFRSWMASYRPPESWTRSGAAHAAEPLPG